jgi:hypothetical protein
MDPKSEHPTEREDLPQKEDSHQADPEENDLDKLAEVVVQVGFRGIGSFTLPIFRPS